MSGKSLGFHQLEIKLFSDPKTNPGVLCLFRNTNTDAWFISSNFICWLKKDINRKLAAEAGLYGVDAWMCFEEPGQ